MDALLNFFLILISLPFWFAASVCIVAGLFGDVIVNGESYRGPQRLPIKIIITLLGIVLGAIAYTLVLAI